MGCAPQRALRVRLGDRVGAARIRGATESKAQRAITRGRRLRAKLGAVTPGLTPFSQPPRPKRMWTRTYQRTLNQVDRAELIADEHFYRGLCTLTARVKRRPH
jgi:hypothetical protein